MVPSSPEEIWRMAQMYADDGDPEFAKRYLQQAYDGLDELEEFGQRNQDVSYLRNQPNLYQQVSENIPETDYNYLPKEAPYNGMNSNETPEEVNNPPQESSMWDRLSGVRENFNNVAGHLGRNWPSYAATAPFLAAGAGLGLGSMLSNRRKKRGR